MRKLNPRRVTPGETGRVRPGIGLALLAAGALLILLGWPSAAPASANDGLRIQKNASGLHGGAREYRLQAKNHGGPTTGTATVQDVLDPQLYLIAFHSTGSGWSCPFPGQGTGKTVTCTKAAASISEDYETVLRYDVCDTVTRGSVNNSASISIAGTPYDSDQANPEVADCTTLTQTPTSTATARATSTNTAVATATSTNSVPLTIVTQTNTPQPTAVNTVVPTLVPATAVSEVLGTTQQAPVSGVAGASTLPRSGQGGPEGEQNTLALILGVALMFGGGLLLAGARMGARQP